MNEPIFFIYYDARSGSTFLSNQLMKQLPLVVIPGTNFVSDIIRKYKGKYINCSDELKDVLRLIRADGKFNDLNVSDSEISTKVSLPISVVEFIKRILCIYKEKTSPDSIAIGIKKGSYLKYHSEIKNLFPDSKFIALIRDPRAVFSSKKNSRMSSTGKSFFLNPALSALEWNYKVSLIASIDSDTSKVIKIKYEDLISDFSGQIDRISSFLCLNPLPQPLKRSYPVNNRYEDLHNNIDKKPMPQRITSWKHELSTREIFIIQSISSKSMLAQGYELEQLPFSLLNYLKLIFYLLHCYIVSGRFKGINVSLIKSR